MKFFTDKNITGRWFAATKVHKGSLKLCLIKSMMSLKRDALHDMI